MLDEAIGELACDSGVILTVDQRDRDMVADMLRGRGWATTEVVTGGPFLGGLRVATPDGRSMVDHTYDARLRARLPAIRVELARLFSGSD
jgi:vacuolar-type H+-ATPase subunit E/Vma4